MPATATPRESDSAIKADVSVAAEESTLIKQTERELGRLDVLVNNAGTTVFVPMQDKEG